jgi:(1->4)-alpha-D-glucan 1-alpha-D-glucosylmutase
MSPEVPPPGSTYRLQLNRSLRFDDAAELTEYLHDLGVDTCYTSPILKARAGSMHGYDVIDHTALNPEIGSMESLGRFVERLKSFGMGLMVDVVPNHMCVSDLSNWRWCDVLENGPSSPHAHFFDIDWNPPREDLADKVLLPTLGDQYGRVLENREVRIEYSSGSFAVRYYEAAFPLAPRTWPLILAHALESARQALGDAHPDVLELESIITALGYLPLRTETDQQRIRERQREKEIIKRRLAGLCAGSEAVSRGVADSLRAINGRKGDPASFNRLEQLLSDQAYRLSFWRVAADEINYRRFFDVNELAAIRTEHPLVFQETHGLIFDLIRKGWITGLRIDHPDGLFDPDRYFKDVQKACVPENGPAAGRRFYVIAEKIVAGDEELRENWEIEGTTGYGFLNLLNGLFVHRGSRRAFETLYERWTGRQWPLADLLYESRRIILRASMSSELNVLARRLDRIFQQHRHSRDFTLETLRFALSEIVACFPVYRTYNTLEQQEPGPEDRRHIQRAVEEAKNRNAATSESVFDAIGSLLLLRDPEGISPHQKCERRMFVMRFQQLTGPVMAKGVEDTACYRYYPLASLGEVGGDLGRFGVTPRLFHRKNAVRLERWPGAMLATSTHDTKRSEDVRARINALSEIPLMWYAAVRRWSDLNAGKRVEIGGETVPDRNAEYLLYQTLVGTWPMTRVNEEEYGGYVRRIQCYMEKALKEAKLRTSWINPDEPYDRAVRDFIAAILHDSASNPFLADLRAFVAPVARAGMLNSLSQVVLKNASPGVPDLYQGCETWNLSLVDPDNRRPVDFQRLRQQLRELQSSPPECSSVLVRELMRTPEDGRIKLHFTSRTLAHRRSHRELYLAGEYIPLAASGQRKHHIVAFARRLDGQVAIAAVARFFLRLNMSAEMCPPRETWGDTVLKLPGHMDSECYREVLTERRIRSDIRAGGRVIRVADLFAGGVPVALLEASPPAGMPPAEDAVQD